MVHHVLTAKDIRLKPEYPGHAKGFSRCSAVDRSVGSTHTGIGLNQLEAGGHVDTHVQSFEEYFYISEGEVTLILDGRACQLGKGACGIIPIGVPQSPRWTSPSVL